MTLRPERSPAVTSTDDGTHPLLVEYSLAVGRIPVMVCFVSSPQSVAALAYRYSQGHMARMRRHEYRARYGYGMSRRSQRQIGRAPGTAFVIWAQQAHEMRNELRRAKAARAVVRDAAATRRLFVS